MSDENPVESQDKDASSPDGESEPEFLALLQFIHRSRNFDFTGYKRSSLIRRIKKRMQMVEIATFGTLADPVRPAFRATASRGVTSRK